MNKRDEHDETPQPDAEDTQSRVRRQLAEQTAVNKELSIQVRRALAAATERERDGLFRDQIAMEALRVMLPVYWTSEAWDDMALRAYRCADAVLRQSKVEPSAGD